MANHASGKIVLENKKKSSTGKYVKLSLFAFYAFIIAYLFICWNIAVLPSDWACMGFAIVTIAECIICAFLKIKSDNPTELSDNEKEGIQFAIDCVGKMFGVSAPRMDTSKKGTKIVLPEISSSISSNDGSD